ncbi:SigE family RNA polymerase sigma factor [Nocardioides eburneiflavus]|uniref:SigE family RNA polymerase sigma factor n=1 Tax=Nocardioides eburneiflavus TaxID=2518372 RepID=UPI00143DC93E|nr:SigE family RNA polymerase sigma factor [Nocardioides eburneiflavus]
MRQSRSGSDFEEFARQQTPQLLVLARAMTGNNDEAWDLVQESLVRMAERWEKSSFDVPEAYVRTVMARLNVDRFRRLRREILRTPHSHRDEVEVVVSDTPLAGWLVESLSDLSPNQRTVIALRFVEDLPVSDIAERLGCSEGTAKSHLSRALARLRASLPEQRPEHVRPRGSVQ